MCTKNLGMWYDNLVKLKRRFDTSDFFECSVIIIICNLKIKFFFGGGGGVCTLAWALFFQVSTLDLQWTPHACEIYSSLLICLWHFLLFSCNCHPFSISWWLLVNFWVCGRCWRWPILIICFWVSLHSLSPPSPRLGGQPAAGIWCTPALTQRLLLLYKIKPLSLFLDQQCDFSLFSIKDENPLRPGTHSPSTVHLLFFASYHVVLGFSVMSLCRPRAPSSLPRSRYRYLVITIFGES